MAKFSRVVALAVGAAGLCGWAATASADGYVAKRGHAPAGCCFSWSGFYVGINGGYGWSADDNAVVNTETVNSVFSARGVFGSLDPSGGFGGAQVGWNAQTGPWVWGIEADFQAADISDDSTGTVINFLPGLNATVDTATRVNWFGTLRTRLGFTWDRTMIYGTGGFAWGSVDHRFLFRDNFGFAARDASSSTETGYTVGAGIEHAFSCCWSVKFEYQYVNLGSQHYTAPLLFVGGGGAATAFAEHTDVDTDFHTVRVGLNWRWHDREKKPLK
jgi:outer membrane immunogenic protein